MARYMRGYTGYGVAHQLLRRFLQQNVTSATAYDVTAKSVGPGWADVRLRMQTGKDGVTPVEVRIRWHRSPARAEEEVRALLDGMGATCVPIGEMSGAVLIDWEV